MSRYFIEAKVYALTYRDYKHIKSACGSCRDSFLLEQYLQPIIEDAWFENWSLVQPNEDMRAKRREIIEKYYSLIVANDGLNKRLYREKVSDTFFNPLKDIYYRIYVQITPLDEKRRIGSLASGSAYLLDYERERLTESQGGKKRPRD